MRLWHYKLLPYLPDAQLRGQLRELVAIMHDWRDKGKTNHILINRVMEYPRSELLQYYLHYHIAYSRRYEKMPKGDLTLEFMLFGNDAPVPDRMVPVYKGWHNKQYLRVCMANLYEKHFGRGASRIADEEWQRLADGYRIITGEDYVI